MTDKLTPVNCGCGGEAIIETDHDTVVPGEPIDWKRVVCHNCNIRTTWRHTECDLVDAFHYLKEYQERQENLDQFETYQFVQNLPLTWDELRQMEDKPVWVEEKAENGLWWTYWVIWQDENAVLPKEKYGTDWKAYRKERTE